jgi:hypothetical protein
MATVLEDPALQSWVHAAQLEPWKLPASEVG